MAFASKSWGLWSISLAALWALAGCSEQSGVEGETGPAIERGATLFAEHCSACHGSDARGNGPIARGLISLPADLTQIAARRDGTYPHDEVYQTIDGRAGRPGHRGPEMPRWGEFWAGFDEAGEEAEVSAKIDALVLYLESIQSPDAPALEASGDTRSTRERMNHLADALEAALPAVFSDLAFSDPTLRRSLDAAVAALASEASSLEVHGGDRSQTFAPLARSLARDAERTRAAFEAGQLRRTRFRFGELLENCVACHTRLPSSPNYADRLVDAIDPLTLPIHEGLRLLLATRQFETAQDRYETLLLETEVDELDRRGVLIDYLIVSIRVLDDSERPRRVLAELAARSDAQPYRAQELERWIASLDAIDAIGAESAAGGPLTQARDLLRRSEEHRRGVRPGASIVYDIAASGHLFRLVEGDTATESELADAYYLLGLTESRIRRPVGRERWDDYLEAAIRLAPGSPTARASFALYEENRLSQFDGFSMLALPRDALNRIEELRDLAFLGATSQ